MHQLDIFLDSRAVTLANEVIAALSARDSASATQSIAQLRCEAPDRPDLPALGMLNDFLGLFEEADLAGLEPDAISVVVDVLSNRIVPAAGVLGRAADAFLDFFWLQLAHAATYPFDPERPQLHAAEFFLRAKAYGAADDAARSIVGHATHHAILHWRAVARYRLAGLDGARLEIFSLAWFVPDSFQDLLRELRDPLLDKDWRAFEAASDDLDASWFPVWYLNRHPATGRAISIGVVENGDKATDRNAGLQAFSLLTRILDLEKLGHSRTLVDQRARLKALGASFFAVYMQSRAVHYR